MVSCAQLWLPILLSAAAVFVASSVIHMVLRWHNSDYRGLANEDEVRAVLRKAASAPGHYVMPYCMDMKAMQSEDMQRRFAEGPVAHLMVGTAGKPNMGLHLGKWFGLNLLVALAVGCLCRSVLAAGAPAAQVFHAAAVAGFLAYGVGSVSDAIWRGLPRGEMFKDLLDALIYAAAGAAVFASMWPHA